MLAERKYRRSVRGLENLMLGLFPKGTELSRWNDVLRYHLKELGINLAITTFIRLCDGVFFISLR